MDHTAEAYYIPSPIICSICKKQKNSFNFSVKNRKAEIPRCQGCEEILRKQENEEAKRKKREAHIKRKLKDPGFQKRNYEEIRLEFLKKINAGKMVVDPEVIKRLEYRLQNERKTCLLCKEEKPISEFYIRIRHGKHINVRPNCKPCHNRETTKGMKNRPIKELIRTYRRTAHKKGREFDLTEDFIESCLEKPCLYCGEDSLLMTLDRKDSDIGYLESNCVPCCIRCNLVKADMPYEAWVVVSNGMRQAKELGLFGSWTGRRNFGKSGNVSK